MLSLSLYDTDPLGEVKLPCPVEAQDRVKALLLQVAPIYQCELSLNLLSALSMSRYGTDPLGKVKLPCPVEAQDRIIALLLQVVPIYQCELSLN